RTLWQYWRTLSGSVHDRSDGEPLNWHGGGMIINGKLIRPHSLQYADDIKWTHCYSVSTPKYYPVTNPLTSLGDVTVVHFRVTKVKFAPEREFEKNLNMIVTRVIPFWDGTSFGGRSTAATERGLDAAVHVMKSYAL